MGCENFTIYIDTIHGACGVDGVSRVVSDCEVECMYMLSIMLSVDHCLEFLHKMALDVELEQIVEYCFNDSVNHSQ